jgi:hypothetical protein
LLQNTRDKQVLRRGVVERIYLTPDFSQPEGRIPGGEASERRKLGKVVEPINQIVIMSIERQEVRINVRRKDR